MHTRRECQRECKFGIAGEEGSEFKSEIIIGPLQLEILNLIRELQEITEINHMQSVEMSISTVAPKEREHGMSHYLCKDTNGLGPQLEPKLYLVPYFKICQQMSYVLVLVTQ